MNRLLLIFVFFIFTNSSYAQLKWEQVKSTPYNTPISAIRKFKNTIYAYGADCLYKSTDGNNWQVLVKDFPSDEQVSMMNTTNDLFVKSYGSFGRIDDGNQAHYMLLGGDWTVASKGDSLIAGHTTTYNWPYKTEIFVSTDLGNNWKKHTPTGLPDSLKYLNLTSFEGRIYCCLDTKIYVSNDGIHYSLLYDAKERCLVVYPFKNALYLRTTGGVLVSSDAGITWVKLTDEYFPEECFFWANESIIIKEKYYDKSLFISSDYGKTWRNFSLKYKFDRVLSCERLSDGELLFGTWKGLFKLNMSDLNVTEVNNGIANNLNVKFLLKDEQTVITGGNSFYVSNDNMKSWDDVVRGGYISCIGYKDSVFYYISDYYINAYSLLKDSTFYPTFDSAFHPNMIFNSMVEFKDKLYCSDGINIFKSDDGRNFKRCLRGDVWSRLYSNDEYVFVLNTNYEKMYRTADGISWDTLNVVFPEYDNFYNYSVDKDAIYYMDGKALLRSKDYCQSWDTLFVGIGEYSAGLFASKENLYILTTWKYGYENSIFDLAVFVSNDMGHTWKKENTFPFSNLNFLKNIDGTVYAGTFNEGLWRLVADNETGFHADKSITENNIKAYPNPASCFIDFEYVNALPVTGKLLLKNSLGQTIMERNYSECNSFSDRISVRDYPDGIYFLEFVAGSQKTVNKIIVRK